MNDWLDFLPPGLSRRLFWTLNSCRLSVNSSLIWRYFAQWFIAMPRLRAQVALDDLFRRQSSDDGSLHSRVESRDESVTVNESHYNIFLRFPWTCDPFHFPCCSCHIITEESPRSNNDRVAREEANIISWNEIQESVSFLSSSLGSRDPFGKKRSGRGFVRRVASHPLARQRGEDLITAATKKNRWLWVLCGKIIFSHSHRHRSQPNRSIKENVK